MSDRVLVMREGRQMGMFAGADLEQERIMTAAVGRRSDRRAAPSAPAPPARTAPASAAAGAGQEPLARRRARRHASCVFSLVVDDYLSARFVSRLLIAISITALLAAGESLVIITRNIDLSVGSIVGVAAYLTAELLAGNTGLPASSPSPSPSAIGAVLGLVNGVLVAVAKVPSIIVTLGTLSIYRSLLTSHAGGKTIATGDLPPWIVDLPRSTVFTIGDYEVRTMFVLALVIVVVLHLVAAVHPRRPPPLRRRLEPGGGAPGRPRTSGACRSPPSSPAARSPGSPGSCTSAASARSTSPPAPGLELAAIAAAVVGGVSTLGGSGTVIGAFLGAVLIGVLDQSLVRVEQISEFWRDAILGALILLAVLLDVAVGRRLRARRTSAAVDRREAADG